MASCTDLVGFTYDADTHCPDCAARRFGADTLDAGNARDSEGNEPGAIFGDSEWSSPIHCGTCRAFLDVALDTDGYAYVLDALEAFALNGSGSADVLRAWWDAYLDGFDDNDLASLARAFVPASLAFHSEGVTLA